MAEMNDRGSRLSNPGASAGMSTRLRAAVALFVVAGLVTWVSTAWAGVARGQDGGNTVTVGALASSSPSSSSPPGPFPSGHGASDSGPSCTYTAISLAEGAGFDLAPGGPTPGDWYLVQCRGRPLSKQVEPSGFPP